MTQVQSSSHSKMLSPHFAEKAQAAPPSEKLSPEERVASLRALATIYLRMLELLEGLSASNKARSRRKDARYEELVQEAAYHTRKLGWTGLVFAIVTPLASVAGSAFAKGLHEHRPRIENLHRRLTLIHIGLGGDLTLTQVDPDCRVLRRALEPLEKEVQEYAQQLSNILQGASQGGGQLFTQYGQAGVQQSSGTYQKLLQEMQESSATGQSQETMRQQGEGAFQQAMRAQTEAASSR